MQPQLLERVSNERCISLIGMAAAGKSTLASLLSHRLGWASLDTDRLIEATAGHFLPDLLQQRGLNDFLHLEERVVAELTVNRCVIATGGSVIYCPRAMARLKASGPVVHLAIDLPTFLSRVGDVQRRALVIPPGLTLEQVHAERYPKYEAAADLTVTTTDASPEACVERILQGIKT